MPQYLELRANAYRNIGYWKDGPSTAEQASQRLHEEVRRLAKIGPGMCVLDVGCGPGQGTVDLCLEYTCERVVGIDLTPQHVEFARRLARSAGVDERLHFLSMSATRLGFEKEEFDRVIAVDCACLFATRFRFFEEAYRVLKRGGALIVADAVIPEPPNRGVNGAIARSLLAHWGIPPENVGNADSCLESMRLAGFQQVECDDIGAYVYEPVAAYLGSNAHHRRYWRRRTLWLRGVADTLLIPVVFRLMAAAHRRGYLDYCLFRAIK